MYCCLFITVLYTLLCCCLMVEVCLVYVTMFCAVTRCCCFNFVDCWLNCLGVIV